MAIAVVMDCSVPTASITQGAPSPAVSAWTAAIASSPRSGTTSVAPKLCAIVVREGWRPSAMTRSAPSRLAASTPHSPTAPSPTTATVVPGAQPAERAAWWPVDITSESASTAVTVCSSSPSGSGTSVPSA
jgi:hypothetical protein